MVSDRGPNVQYPIGQSPLFQGRFGNAMQGSGANGFGIISQRIRSLSKKPNTGEVVPGVAATGRSSDASGAARYPGLPPVTNPDYIGLNQAGANGEIYDPESFFRVRRNPIDASRFKAMASAARAYNGTPNTPVSATEGYGPGASSADSIRKLIMQRLGVVS